MVQKLPAGTQAASAHRQRRLGRLLKFGAFPPLLLLQPKPKDKEEDDHGHPETHHDAHDDHGHGHGHHHEHAGYTPTEKYELSSFTQMLPICLACKALFRFATDPHLGDEGSRDLMVASYEMPGGLGWLVAAFWLVVLGLLMKLSRQATRPGWHGTSLGNIAVPETVGLLVFFMADFFLEALMIADQDLSATLSPTEIWDSRDDLVALLRRRWFMAQFALLLCITIMEGIHPVAGMKSALAFDGLWMLVVVQTVSLFFHQSIARHHFVHDWHTAYVLYGLTLYQFTHSLALLVAVVFRKHIGVHHPPALHEVVMHFVKDTPIRNIALALVAFAAFVVVTLLPAVADWSAELAKVEALGTVEAAKVVETAAHHFGYHGHDSNIPAPWMFAIALQHHAGVRSLLVVTAVNAVAIWAAVRCEKRHSNSRGLHEHASWEASLTIVTGCLASLCWWGLLVPEVGKEVITWPYACRVLGAVAHFMLAHFSAEAFAGRLKANWYECAAVLTWAAYQVLQGLATEHHAVICHGAHHDITVRGVLVHIGEFGMCEFGIIVFLGWITYLTEHVHEYLAEFWKWKESEDAMLPKWLTNLRFAVFPPLLLLLGKPKAKVEGEADSSHAPVEAHGAHDDHGHGHGHHHEHAGFTPEKKYELSSFTQILPICLAFKALFRFATDPTLSEKTARDMMIATFEMPAESGWLVSIFWAAVLGSLVYVSRQATRPGWHGTSLRNIAVPETVGLLVFFMADFLLEALMIADADMSSWLSMSEIMTFGDDLLALLWRRWFMGNFALLLCITIMEGIHPVAGVKSTLAFDGLWLLVVVQVVSFFFHQSISRHHFVHDWHTAYVIYGLTLYQFTHSLALLVAVVFRKHVGVHHPPALHEVLQHFIRKTPLRNFGLVAFSGAAFLAIALLPSAADWHAAKGPEGSAVDAAHHFGYHGHGSNIPAPWMLAMALSTHPGSYFILAVSVVNAAAIWAAMRCDRRGRGNKHGHASWEASLVITTGCLASLCWWGLLFPDTSHGGHIVYWQYALRLLGAVAHFMLAHFSAEAFCGRKETTWYECGALLTWAAFQVLQGLATEHHAVICHGSHHHLTVRGILVHLGEFGMCEFGIIVFLGWLTYFTEHVHDYLLEFWHLTWAGEVLQTFQDLVLGPEEPVAAPAPKPAAAPAAPIVAAPKAHKELEIDLSRPLGIGFDRDLTVMAVLPGSQASELGVTKGWKALFVGGVAVNSDKELIGKVQALKGSGVASVSVAFANDETATYV